MCNRKRTDLCDLILSKACERGKPLALFKSAKGKSPKAAANLWKGARGRPGGPKKELWFPRIFQGHTRFATSSVSDLGGCHPHQWTPPSRSNLCWQIRELDVYKTWATTTTTGSSSSHKVPKRASKKKSFKHFLELQNEVLLI